MANNLQLNTKLGTINSFEGVLMLVLFTLPLGDRVVNNLAMLLFVLNSFWFLKIPDWKRALQSPIVWAPAAFFLLHVVSLLYTQNVDEGLKGLETKLSFLLAPIFIVAGASRFTAESRQKFLWAFTAGVLGACLWALGTAAWLAWQQGAWFYDLQDGFGRRYYFVYTHLAKPIMHPGYFSTYLGFGIFCLLALWPRLKNRWPLVLLLPGFFAIMLLLQGRINLIALFITFILAGLIIAVKRKAFKWLLLPVVPVAFLGLLLVFASTDFKARYFQPPNFNYDISGTSFNSATYRLAEWHCAAQVIKEQPILGTGFGDHKEALLKAYKENKFWEGLRKRFNAHNQYLETTMALGLVGLLFLLTLFTVYTIMAWQQKNYLVLLCLTFFAISMLTESMLVRAWAVLLFNAFMPIFLVLGSKSNNTKPPALVLY